MHRPHRFLFTLCIFAIPCFAKNWTGALVDSKCYAYAEGNVNPTDTMTAVDRDRRSEIRSCSPKAKTKSFTLVQQDGPSFQLDPAGNIKASELVRQIGQKRLFLVDIAGTMEWNVIKVDSILLAK